ncbi:hypothetical protein RZS08_65425, partial [Arthrospira platensis SPKY1]|nr:hypothetical protein [Arthrospira platensis SPKY1]
MFAAQHAPDPPPGPDRRIQHGAHAQRRQVIGCERSGHRVGQGVFDTHRAPGHDSVEIARV